MPFLVSKLRLVLKQGIRTKVQKYFRMSLDCSDFKAKDAFSIGVFIEEVDLTRPCDACGDRIG